MALLVLQNYSLACDIAVHIFHILTAVNSVQVVGSLVLCQEKPNPDSVWLIGWEDSSEWPFTSWRNICANFILM